MKFTYKISSLFFLVTVLVNTLTSCAATSPRRDSSGDEISRHSDIPSLFSKYRVAIVAAETEEAELKEIGSLSLELLQSPKFIANLLSLRNNDDKVVSAVSATKPEFITFTQLADILTLKSKDFYKFRSHFVLLGTYFNTGNIYTGTCKLNGNSMNCKAYEFEDNRDNEFVASRVVTMGGDSILESVIGRKIHERWKADSLERKSCAINTFTHELLHAFSQKDTSTFHQNYFIDTLSLDQVTQYGNYPIATYLAGAVAQCTWLQQKKGYDDVQFKACVERFGQNKFNSNECI